MNTGQRHTAERATVITDVVIMLPVLLFMIAGMFMLGTRISDLMYLNQSARELGMVLTKLPYMQDLGPRVQFKIDPRTDDPGQLKDQAEACIQLLSDSAYEGCTGAQSAGCNCPELIAQWYAMEFMRMKLMLVDWPISVAVGFNPRPGDLASGLCFIDVILSGTHRTWPLVGGGEVGAEAHVPYMSYPVPWNAGTCTPSYGLPYTP